MINRAGDYRLVVTLSVEISRIDEIDPLIQGGFDGCNTLLEFIGAPGWLRSRETRHPHTTQSQRRDQGAILSENSSLHTSFL